MVGEVKQDVQHITRWIATLIENYRLEPSEQLGKVIDYYFIRLIRMTAYQERSFDIFSMKRYWRWVSNQNMTSQLNNHNKVTQIKATSLT